MAKDMFELDVQVKTLSGAHEVEGAASVNVACPIPYQTYACVYTQNGPEC